MIFGLGAALGWGFGDVGAAMAGRRIGSFITVLVAHVTSTIAITVLFLGVAPDTSRLGHVAGWLVPNALITALAYITLYRGLELGPISVVSPILASYAVVPVALSFALLDQRISNIALVGIVVTIAGSVLTSIDLRAFRSRDRETPKGVPWAVASSFLFGLSAYVFGWSSHGAGWLPALWLSRITTTAVFLVLLGVFGSERRRFQSAGARGLGLATLVGAADVLGVISYARGAEVGLLSIVTAASATYVLIPVVVSIVALKERPAPNQLIGVGVVVAGLLLLGFM